MERPGAKRKVFSVTLGTTVTGTPDSFDEGGAGRVGLDFLAEIEDVLVEGAGLRIVFEAPTFVEEFVAGENFATAAGEEGEHLHFADGEFDLNTVPPCEKTLGMDFPRA
jgi:hypothetical protein